MLLAAKVLVISRLLHAKLSKRPSPPPYLETLRGRLATLRRRLLARIDRRFKSLEVEKDALMEAMCAFTLATSSGPVDVVRHFHHLRLEAVSEYMREAAREHRNMLTALRLYLKTSRDTQAVVPIQLSQALGKLKAVPIFKGRDLYDLIELNLDVHERWVGEDIKSFTPYVRHDDLSKIEAEGTLKQWAGQGVKAFLEGLKGTIRHVQDLKELMQLRRQALELWLGQHQYSLGIDFAEVLDGLRDVFNEQAKAVIHARVTKLKGVGSAVEHVIRDWQEGVSDALPSLWSSSMTSMDTNNGAKAYRQRLMDLSTGKSQPLQDITAQYNAWSQGIQTVEQMVKQLKATKWAEVVDDADDEDDLLSSKQILLSEDDPRALEDTLRDSLSDAFAQLETSLSSIASKISSEQQGHQTTFLLRTWREIRKSLPQSFGNPNIGNDTILNLLTILAKIALSSPLNKCSRRISKIPHATHLPARQLWEGDPELPVLPSPWSYRLLLDIMQSMADYGTDIWSPEAVRVTKRGMIEQLANMLVKSPETAFKVNEHVNGEVNGADEAIDTAEGPEAKGEDDGPPHVDAQMNGSITNSDNPDPERGEDVKVQNLFDMFYLSNATAIKELNDDDNGLVRCQRSLMEDIALEADCVERMRKSAAEYWKRTSLLFGLLA